MTKLQVCLTAGLLLTAIGTAGCPAVWNAIKRTAVQCGPDLIREVAGILLSDDWRVGLEAKAGVVGIDLVTCAVKANAGEPMVGKLIEMPKVRQFMGGRGVYVALPSSADHDRRVRAQLWLADQKR